MSVLAFIGLRHPLRMLPVLLFEVAWKLTWLGVAVIPWRRVLAQYVIAPGEPWRRSR
jgi:hypothetical protein